MNAIATTITPSDQQWTAVRKAVAWYKMYREAADKSSVQQVFRFFGYAGVGKTELAKFIIKEMGLTNVLGACFTGKAAHMMKVRGFPNSQTLHSLIYTPIDKGKGSVPEMEEQLKLLILQNADERLIDRLKADIRREIQGLRNPGWMLKIESDLREADLLVIDECSMVGTSMGNDILTFGVPVLVLGDPAQLPPVADGGFFTEVDEPDVMLTEIHRNAKDSAIIRMATMARIDGWVPPGVYQDPSGFDSIISYRNDVDRMMSADQILVGMNRTRHATNKYVRHRRGFKGTLPMAGERIICLKNRAEYGLMNGAFYTMLEDAIDVDETKCIVKIKSDDFPENGDHEVLAHKVLFGGDKESLNPWEWNEAQGFDFAPAVTVHKYQGSQAPHVLLNAEWNRRESWKQWFYTGLTRAQISTYAVVPG